MEDHAIHLAFSANRWESRDEILRQVSDGITVICDRYAYSGVAFTASKGIDVEWCKNPDRGLPRPDAVFYLDLPVEQAMKRGAFGQELYETKSVQQKAKDVYEQQLWDDSYWHRICADTTQEALHDALKKLALATVDAISPDDTPLSLLWMNA